MIRVRTCYCNWGDCRLWDAMEKYETNIDKDIIAHKNAWIGEKVKQIEKRRDLKMYLHKERYDRIISVVYNTRLLEVRAHSTRFQSHKVVSFFAQFFIRSPNSPPPGASFHHITKLCSIF